MNKISNQTLPKDELEWEKFNNNSLLDIKNFPIKVQPFNRLIMHTDNFYMIAGYGAFNKGYTLLIPKKLISSFASLDDTLLEEFHWFKDTVKKILTEVFNDHNIAIFEHGLCACLGGLDRAHLHFMPYKKKNSHNIKSSINRCLKRRRVGNLEIIFKEYKLTSPDDIDFFLENNDKNKDKDYTISGSQYTFENIISSNDVRKYPINLKENVLNNNPYIFFDSGHEDGSFITFENIETQFGREIVFNLDYFEEADLSNFLSSNNLKKNEENFLWKWQDYLFDSNILETIALIGTYLNKGDHNIEVEKFNLKTY